MEVKSYTNEEIQERKENFEDQIASLIAEFEEMTGKPVASIEIKRTYSQIGSWTSLNVEIHM